MVLIIRKCAEKTAVGPLKLIGMQEAALVW